MPATPEFRPAPTEPLSGRHSGADTDTGATAVPRWERIRARDRLMGLGTVAMGLVVVVALSSVEAGQHPPGLCVTTHERLTAVAPCSNRPDSAADQDKAASSHSSQNDDETASDPDQGLDILPTAHPLELAIPPQTTTPAPPPPLPSPPATTPKPETPKTAESPRPVAPPPAGRKPTVPGPNAINVLARGVAGTGATDDSVAIQAVLDGAEPGSVIYFPNTSPGFYRLDQPLHVRKPLTLVGDGTTAVSEIRQVTSGRDGPWIWRTISRIFCGDIRKFL